MTKNKFFSLDSLLLFILVLLYIQECRFDNFFSSFLFYGFSLFLLSFYFLVDWKYSLAPHLGKIYKIFILIFLFTLLIGSITLALIYGRYVGLSSFSGGGTIHDGAIQTEEALNFLSQGKNPYRENYFGTSLEKWYDGKIDVWGKKITNPSLYHYVYLPFSLEFSWPFYQIGKILFHYYDARILNLFAYFLTLFFLWKIPKNLDKKFLGIILFSLNPLFASEISYGANNIIMLLPLVIALYFLKKEKFYFSSFFLALSMGIKQPVWFILPFYLIYLFFKKDTSWLIRIKFVLKNTWPLFLTLLFIFLPFLLWDLSSFFNSVIKYLSGSLSTSYPINGIGFSSLLLNVGLIKSLNDYFPFWIFQFFSGLFIFYFFLQGAKKSFSIGLLAATFSLLSFWYFSRFFYQSHLGTISTFFILAYFFDD